MNVMTCPNEGLSYLLSKYQVAAEGEARLVKGKNALLIGEKEYALLPWRYERRMVELKNLLNDGTLKDPCVLRTTLITHKDECLRCMIKREFDIAEFLFDSKIVAVYAVMADDKLANMVTKLDCGVVVNYELAATLAEGAQIMDKHEIIASVGVALDKVVDTQINQNSIYVYGARGLHRRGLRALRPDHRPDRQGSLRLCLAEEPRAAGRDGPPGRAPEQAGRAGL